jgi:GH24 family phage-related lysozyme (muramidase)
MKHYANYYTISDDGKNLIKDFEGLKLSVYPDADGYSVGYGHFLGKEKPPFTTISKENADMFFDADITRINTALNAKLTNRDLKQNVIDAVGSFAYNVGTGEYLSKVAAFLNKNDLAGASGYMKKIIYSQKKKNDVLIKRRKIESDLLMQGIGIAPVVFFLLVLLIIFVFLKIK